MSKINRILVVIDRQRDPELAIQRGVDLAKASGAPIELYGCEYDPALFLHYVIAGKKDKLSKNAYVAECEAWLKKKAEAMREQGIEVEIYADWRRDLTAGVLDRLKLHPADIVIKDTRHDSRIQRTLFHSSDWNLIRDCPVPLLLAKRGSRGRKGPVIAAVDPLHEDDPKQAQDSLIWKTAKAFAEREQRDCRLFHAMNVIPETVPLAMDVVLYGDYDQVLRRETKRHIEQFAANQGIAEQAIEIREGPPSVTLPEYAAESDASLVVMGSVSRSHWPVPLITTTAEAVLDRLDCDVLVVKADQS